MTAARNRLEQLRLKSARLTGLRESAIRREAELVEKVSHAKGRLCLVEEVDGVLEGLQQRAHQRSVGVFEKMLTAIMGDVLPGKGEVRLALGTERGAPSLDVQIDNGGAVESAFEGSGGAVTNVLSAGLRFAALSRTTNRRFVVLDEADCWLKPERVPAFIRVLADVASRAGTQTVLISHHEPALFEGLVDMVKLSRTSDGALHAQVLEPHGDGWVDDETPGVRSIQLINFRAHTDTTLPLFPKVTALIGDNDVGKSTLAVSALRAVAYGEGDDTLIRHGATEAKVIIRLEKGKRIEWVRRSKGSPRVSYALYEGDCIEPVHQGRPSARGQVPEWVTEALGVVPVDDLDIQIGSQKSPVFLLDEGPSTRAQLLSVGREAGRLHALIEGYGELKSSDRELVRTGETEIALLRQKLEASTTLDETTGRFAQLGTRLEEIENSTQQQSRLAALVERLASLEKREFELEVYAQILEGLPKEMPTLTPTERLQSLIRRIERCERTTALQREFQLPEIPALRDVSRIAALGQRIARLERRAALSADFPPLPALPAVKDLSVLSRSIDRLSERVREQARLTQEEDAAQCAAGEAHEELKELVEAMGGVCPSCGGQMDTEGQGVAHEHREIA